MSEEKLQVEGAAAEAASAGAAGVVADGTAGADCAAGAVAGAVPTADNAAGTDSVGAFSKSVTSAEDAGTSAPAPADSTAGAAPDADAAPNASGADEPTEEELAAARELAEHNALADVFDDVRKQSADSHLVTPDRWPEIGLVPEHMTAEEFEMFVYEWLEDYLNEHADEIEAERAAERAKAASVRSATHAVGVPPKIPNRRLAQIEADEEAAKEEAAEAATENASENPAEALPKSAPSAQSADTANAVDAGSNSPATSQESAAADATVPSANDAANEPASTTVAAATPAPATSEPAEAPNDAAAAEDDSSPFAGLRIPEGYKLEQIEGEWVLVEDENAAPVRKEIKCNRIKVLMGMHSYYLYDETLMTDSYAHWAFLAAEDNPVVTFVECVREDSRVYPRPYAAVCLKNPPFRMSDEQIEQTWKTVQESGNYPDIQRTEASNGDVYYFSTQYLEPGYAASLAEYDAVERPADV